MLISPILQNFHILHEVTAHLTLPELLQLRTVSTQIRDLVDADDLWERRFVQDANLLSKAIFFAWIQHVSKALQSAPLAAKDYASGGENARVFLEHSWVFVPNPRSDSVNAGSIPLVRDGMLRRLCTEFRRQHLSIVFTPAFWGLTLPDDSRLGIADAKWASMSVKAVELGLASPGQRTIVDGLSTSVFVRLCQSSGDVGTFLSNAIGFDKIRQILFGKRTSVECLAAARLMKDLRDHFACTDSTTAHDRQVPRYAVQDLFRDPAVLAESQPFFKGWMDVYKFFLVPLTEDHPFAKHKPWASTQDRFYTTFSTWNSLTKFYATQQISPELSKSALRSATPADIAAFHFTNSIDGFRTGIHRTELDFQTATLMQVRLSEDAMEWGLCLHWLAGFLEDVTPWVRIIQRGPQGPGIIFGPISGFLPPSRALLSWRVVSYIAMPLGLIRFASILLGQQPTALPCAVPVAFCLTVILRFELCKKKSPEEKGEEWSTLLLEQRRQVLPRLLGFFAFCLTPVALGNRCVLSKPFISPTNQFRWGLFISLERWKYNLQIISRWAGSFLLFRFLQGLVVLSLSLALEVSFENCWRKELMFFLTGWELCFTINRHFETFREHQTILRQIRMNLFPSVEQLNSVIQPILPLDGLRCQCFDCVGEVRELPPVAHLLRQLTDLEMFLIPTTILFEILYREYSTPERAPSITADLVDPVLHCLGTAALAAFLSLCLNIGYWSVALTRGRLKPC